MRSTLLSKPNVTSQNNLTSQPNVTSQPNISESYLTAPAIIGSIRNSLLPKHNPTSQPYSINC
jgi:hypothetical protein